MASAFPVKKVYYQPAAHGKRLPFTLNGKIQYMPILALFLVLLSFCCGLRVGYKLPSAGEAVCLCSLRLLLALHCFYPCVLLYCPCRGGSSWYGLSGVEFVAIVSEVVMAENVTGSLCLSTCFRGDVSAARLLAHAKWEQQSRSATTVFLPSVAGCRRAWCLLSVGVGFEGRFGKS